MPRNLTFLSISASMAFLALGWSAFAWILVEPIHAVQVVQQEEEEEEGETEGGSDKKRLNAALNKDLAKPIVDAKSYLEVLDSDQFRGRLSFAPVKLPKEELAKVVTELRKRYPFQSIAKKLKYEKQRVELRGENGSRDIVTEATEKRLKVVDGQHIRARVRTLSLQKLHSDEVESFINRSEFGLSRMPQPGIEQLPIVKLPSLPLSNPNLVQSVEYQGPPVELPEKKREVSQKKTGQESEVTMVSAEEVRSIHHLALYQFGSGPENGYVKDRENVAGFESHRIGYLTHIRPPFPPSDNAQGEQAPSETWQVKRMELVSLLNFDEPAVYISNEIPQIEKIKDAKVRPLDRFEQAGLQILRDGEDNHIEATLNRVKMLGSLRAGKSCTDCHYVKRGELLGAFSYDIVRAPAIAAKSSDK